MFNKAKRQAKKEMKIEQDATEEMNSRCLPAARKILALLSEARVDDVKSTELFGDYSPLGRDVMDILMENEIKLNEVDFVFRMVFQAPTMLKEIVQQTLNKGLSSAQEKFWGKDPNEVTVEELDVKLKEDAKE